MLFCQLRTRKPGGIGAAAGFVQLTCRRIRTRPTMAMDGCPGVIGLGLNAVSRLAPPSSIGSPLKRLVDLCSSGSSRTRRTGGIGARSHGQLTSHLIRTRRTKGRAGWDGPTFSVWPRTETKSSQEDTTFIIHSRRWVPRITSLWPGQRAVSNASRVDQGAIIYLCMKTPS